MPPPLLCSGAAALRNIIVADGAGGYGRKVLRSPRTFCDALRIVSYADVC